MTMKGLTLPFVAIIVLLSCNSQPTADVQPASPGISIYPNPVSTLATISIFTNNQVFLLRVFDTKGVVMYEQTNLIDQTYHIDMSVRPVGTYEVIFSSGATVINQKLIKP